MLSLTPKRLTFLLLSLFTFVFMAQHLVYILQLNNAELDTKGFGGHFEKGIKLTLPFLEPMARVDYDLHLRRLHAKDPDPRVAIIEINERSLQALGQFPFSRKTYADFIKKLEQNNAKVIGFDITFPEMERNTALAELAALKNEIRGAENTRLIDERIKKSNGDEIFENAIRESKIPVVLGFSYFSRADENKDVKKIDAETVSLVSRHGLRTSQVVPGAFNYTDDLREPVAPQKQLLKALPEHSTLGEFTATADADNIIRRAVLVTEYNRGFMGSLGLQAVAKYLGVNPVVVNDNGYYITDDKGLMSVPLDPLGSLNVRYYGKERVIPYYEFIDVLNGKVSHELSGKILFLGVSAMGLKDIRANPFSEKYPGTEVHATVASNILQNYYLVKDSRYFWYGYLFLLCFGLSISFFVYNWHPIAAFAITIGSIFTIQFMAQNTFFAHGIVVPSFWPSLACIAVLFTGTLYRFFNEAKEKKFVRAAFSRYVSGAVVEEILKDQTKLRLGGQKKELTVMFCDMKGFTKLSEGLDAAVLTGLLNQFFTRMTRIVLANNGTLDKFMGDAIMCFWGAPLDLPNHAELSCKAALEMLQELKSINAEWKEKFGLEVSVRIGINTGEMYVGNMGSDQAFSYTVLGDSVNLGSRLEGANNIYGTTIIVGEQTEKLAQNKYLFRELDEVMVKGKEEKVAIFELVGTKAELNAHEEWVHAFEEGLKFYRKGEWNEAQAHFGTCLSLRPQDGATKVFLERIEHLKQEAPKDWDGSWKLVSK